MKDEKEGKLCGRVVYLAPDGTEHVLLESRTKPDKKEPKDNE